MSTAIAAYTFAFLILATILFQLALALGAPWGNLAMGGRFPGRFPIGMRIAAIAQALILGFLALIVLARARIYPSYLHEFSRTAIWGAIAITTISFIMNLITPSRLERAIWAPVALILTACGLIVAVQPGT